MLEACFIGTDCSLANDSLLKTVVRMKGLEPPRDFLPLEPEAVFGSWFQIGKALKTSVFLGRNGFGVALVDHIRCTRIGNTITKTSPIIGRTIRRRFSFHSANCLAGRESNSTSKLVQSAGAIV